MQDIPKIVERRLKAVKPKDAAHPDADLLTAFSEQVLPRDERERMVAHLADCGECREVIAMALPANHELQANAFRGRGWVLWARLRWGLAAAAVVVLAAVGVLQVEQRRHEQAAALSSKGEFPPQKETVAAANQTLTPTNETPGTPGSAVVTAQKHARVVVRSRERIEPPAARDSAGKTESQNVVTARNEAPVPSFGRQTQPTSPYQSTTDADVVKAKEAVSATAAAAAAPAPQLQTPASLMSKASPKWKVTSDGLLQRSFDAGTTWESVDVSAGNSAVVADSAKAIDSSKRQGTPIFRAVAAIGTEAWAGGSGAILYHSDDSGARWRQVVPSADGSSASGDIVEIRFSDLQNGRIATSTGEAWITADAGASWQKQ